MLQRLAFVAGALDQRIPAIGTRMIQVLQQFAAVAVLQGVAGRTSCAEGIQRLVVPLEQVRLRSALQIRDVQLDTVLLTDPDGNTELRAIDADPITRRTSSTTASLGSSLNAPVGDWNLALTLDAARGWSTSEIDRRRDTSGLVAAAAAGDQPASGSSGRIPSSATTPAAHASAWRVIASWNLLVYRFTLPTCSSG